MENIQRSARLRSSLLAVEKGAAGWNKRRGRKNVSLPTAGFLSVLRLKSLEVKMARVVRGYCAAVRPLEKGGEEPDRRRFGAGRSEGGSFFSYGDGPPTKDGRSLHVSFIGWQRSFEENLAPLVWEPPHNMKGISGES